MVTYNTCRKVVKDVISLFSLEQLTRKQLAILLTSKFTNPYEIDAIVDRFFTSKDHGFKHSVQVWKRCKKIKDVSPTIWNEAQLGLSCADSLKVLLLASLFHDIARFWTDFKNHEQASADFVFNLLGPFNQKIASYTRDAIVRHDYFCFLADGTDFPDNLRQPLSEIFRLADKTSLSPADEIIRYHQTAQRLHSGMPIFDPMISDDIRFDLANNLSRRTDELTWFLMIFALQSTDFIFGDTRDAYAAWAGGKTDALNQIVVLCLHNEYVKGRCPVDQSEVVQVIRRFCKQHDLFL